MMLNFPKDEETLSLKDSLFAYGDAIDQHLNFLKQQSDCEFFYWKGAGIFLLAAFALFILQDKGIIPSALIGVLIAGVASLLILTQNIRMDLEYGVQAAVCVEKGLNTEQKYDYPIRIFGSFTDNKSSAYKANIASKLFPIGSIGIAMATGGTILAIKVGTCLAVIVATLSIALLSIAAQSYIKTARKILLGA